MTGAFAGPDYLGDFNMHDYITIRSTYAETRRLFWLSLTPLGLIGIPRYLSGKTMHSWYFSLSLYALGFMLQLVLFQCLTEGIPLPALIFSCLHHLICIALTWAISLHVLMVLKDVRMFWRISQRLKGLLDAVPMKVSMPPQTSLSSNHNLPLILGKKG